ncbi:hypothetical protein Pmani_024157 [Petrolisthes manimaculis]|uniref:Uncharacterized protein n=1 Tax=Petrolisthes manimaculis TaxID=1843537 RepID=A0AAE1P8T4_9EUCA|nr:hypothetical protein Pmani_024157 [Petrolisthes manimaculis]
MRRANNSPYTVPVSIYVPGYLPEASGAETRKFINRCLMFASKRIIQDQEREEERQGPPTATPISLHIRLTRLLAFNKSNWQDKNTMKEANQVERSTGCLQNKVIPLVSSTDQSKPIKDSLNKTNSIISSMADKPSEQEWQCTTSDSLRSSRFCKNIMKTICYVCNSQLVCGDDVANHLIFGSLSCKHCKLQINGCKNLRSRLSEQSDCPIFKQNIKYHDYSNWDQPKAYLARCIEADLKISKYNASSKYSVRLVDISTGLESLLEQLLPIRELMPWKSAFKYFTHDLPADPSTWPPPLPRLGWAVRCESSTIGIDKHITNIVEERKKFQEKEVPDNKNATLKLSQSKSSVYNSRLKEIDSSKLLTSNISSTGEQGSHQGGVRCLSPKKQPSLSLKDVKQYLPVDCPSLSAKKARETFIDKVSTPSCERGSSSSANITTKDNGSSTADSGESASSFRICKKATSNSSQCSSAINKHQLTTESSNLYLNLRKVRMNKQSDSTLVCSSIVTKQPTCSDSFSSQVVKLPVIPRPVTPQDTNELDSLKPFSSHVTSLPIWLKSENRVVVKEARSPSKSPQKGKKRKIKKLKWGKQKSHKKNYDVTAEGDEEDTTKELQKLNFLSEEDLKSRRFLLVSLPKQTCPKECPECNTILTFIAVNIFNYKIGKITCPDCNLNIYILKP